MPLWATGDSPMHAASPLRAYYLRSALALACKGTLAQRLALAGGR